MPKQPAPVVTTASGRLRGRWKVDGTIAVFRGVPYAAPPVGERRWRPPAPVEPWAGERPATKPGPISIQRGTDFDAFIDALFSGQGWSRVAELAST